MCLCIHEGWVGDTGCLMKVLESLNSKLSLNLTPGSWEPRMVYEMGNGGCE